MAVNCTFSSVKITVSLAKNSTALKLDSENGKPMYAGIVSGWNNGHGQAAPNEKKSHSYRDIHTFVGEHKETKTNIDVTLLTFTTMHYMDCIPQSISTTFTQLTTLRIQDCGLKEISRKSLIGLEKLEILIVDNNLITTLPRDLLVDMSRLKVIAFQGNLLKFVDSQMLTIIENNLLHVDLRLNPSIDAFYSVNNPTGSVSLQQLISVIDAKCAKPHLQLNVNAEFFVQGHTELWETGVLSDFTIETSFNEFRVHRAILAGGSPVFAAMFATNMKEQQDSRMVMKDFTSEDVRDFLRFFYFGRVTGSINAVEIFKLADKYNVRDLKHICEALLMDTIQENNAAEILELGTLYNNDVLKKEAFRKIKIALSGRSIPSHWINEPERMKQIMETKLQLDSLFTETNISDV